MPPGRSSQTLSLQTDTGHQSNKSGHNEYVSEVGKARRGQREAQVKGGEGKKGALRGEGEKERNTGSYPEITEEEQDGSWKELTLCMSWIIIISTT